MIAKQAAHLFVFQRTPNFSVPAHNRPVDHEMEQWIKEHFAEYRQRARESSFGTGVPVNEQSAMGVTVEEREIEFKRRWEYGGLFFALAFSDLWSNKDANELAADFVRSKIREAVHDPAVAEALSPRDHYFATKRLCVDTNYFETYNRSNVTLVDLRRAALEEITPKGIRTKDAEYEVDTIVLATGFDAMTGPLLNIDIRGRDGVALREKWEHGPRTYLGLMTVGFPNLFMITGPGSPSVLSNMVISIEQHVEWLSDCLAYLGEHGIECIEPEMAAEDSWVLHVNEVADQTLFPTANSWYIGANVPGKPRVFMPYIGGVALYRQKCDEVASNGYTGFTLSA